MRHNHSIHDDARKRAAALLAELWATEKLASVDYNLTTRTTVRAAS